jgi:hypothetical protein
MSCYVLIGFDGESIESAAERLQAVWDLGCMPFAQLYQPPEKYIEYPREWKRLARNWSKPMIVRARMREHERVR